jgi:hypothetical protein
MLQIKLFIFYASYLVFPFLVLLFYKAKNWNKYQKLWKTILYPDTTLKYKNNLVDLTLCWHTHWGQIKIPYLYKKVIPTKWIFDEWLTMEKNTQLFVTSWLWIIGLPFRFLNPPVIDILEIK